MVRNRKRMALYEVIGKTRVKPGKAEDLQKLRPQESKKSEPPAPQEKITDREKLTGWPKKPSKIQLNAGRIEFSVPYQFAIAMGLAVMLIVLVCFRLGQIYQRGLMAEPIIGQPPRWQAKIEQIAPAPEAGTDAVREAPAAAEDPARPESKGNNRIVIQTYENAEQLEPVQEYFAYYGIATEIRRIQGRCFLVTSEKYDNPGKQGTDGFKARQRIVELGAKYKPPGPQYESFGSSTSLPFHDAYGMKFDD